ncbi:MAG: Ig-like domain repeat protein, partial [Nocardioides sp.]
NVLSVQPGAWGLGTLPTFGYQWYLDGRPITGATGSQYVVKVTDAGRTVAVLVTATRLGFTQASATTAPVTVAKVASRTSLKLLKKRIKQGTAGLLRITLAPSSLRPAGKVKVFDGRRLLKTYTVRAADNGTRIVKLPRLKAGKHKLTARFAGTRATTASKSAAVVLTVTRRR